MVDLIHAHRLFPALAVFPFHSMQALVVVDFQILHTSPVFYPHMRGVRAVYLSFSLLYSRLSLDAKYYCSEYSYTESYAHPGAYSHSNFDSITRTCE